MDDFEKTALVVGDALAKKITAVSPVAFVTSLLGGTNDDKWREELDEQYRDLVLELQSRIRVLEAQFGEIKTTAAATQRVIEDLVQLYKDAFDAADINAAVWAAANRFNPVIPSPARSQRWAEFSNLERTVRELVVAIGDGSLWIPNVALGERGVVRAGPEVFVASTDAYTGVEELGWVVDNTKVSFPASREFWLDEPFRDLWECDYADRDALLRVIKEGEKKDLVAMVNGPTAKAGNVFTLTRDGLAIWDFARAPTAFPQKDSPPPDLSEEDPSPEPA